MSAAQPQAAGQEALVRVAARALARAGLVHAYGHCSARLDAGHFLVCAARPMGLIEPGEAGTVVPVKYGVNRAVTVRSACTSSISHVAPSVPLVRVQALAASKLAKRQPGLAVAAHWVLPLWATLAGVQATPPPMAGRAAPVMA